MVNNKNAQQLIFPFSDPPQEIAPWASKISPKKLQEVLDYLEYRDFLRSSKKGEQLEFSFVYDEIKTKE